MRHPLAVLSLSVLIMAASAPSVQRLDPYKNYKFRVSFGGSYVAAFQEVTQMSSPSVNTTAAVAPNSGNSTGGNGLGAGLGNGGPGATKTVALNQGGGSSVQVQVPGSLVGQQGTVTLLCSVSPGAPGAPTITLVCANPPLGGGIVGNNALGQTNASPNVSKIAPSSQKYEVITLKRGATQDQSFQSWASSLRSGPARDFAVDVFNEAGQRIGSSSLRGCTVATFQGLPSMDGTSNTMSIIELDLHCNSQ